LIKRSTPIYLYCVYDEIFELIKSLGFKNVYSLDLNLPISIGDFIVTPRQALDADVDSLFQVQVAGINILNVVDSWIDSTTLLRLEKLGPWDLIMWPFQTMQEIEVLSPKRLLNEKVEIPHEWIDQLRTLKPKNLIPSSCQFIQEDWSWYQNAFFPISYKDFIKKLNDKIPSTHVFKLNPGCSITMDKKSMTAGPPLEFVKPIGNQDVDYHYKPYLQPIPTSEIAKKFPSLCIDKTKAVFDFCQSELIERYQSLPQASDGYFEKERVWRLLVFDHEGKSKCFDYKLKGNHAQLIGNDFLICSETSFQNDSELKKTSSYTIGWLTEIPIAKLYGALKEGEALNSIYVRINDCIFADSIEAEIKLADVMEDPLLRCLFSGQAGSYQMAQLKRIRSSNQFCNLKS
jgi:hypothetical protein